MEKVEVTIFEGLVLTVMDMLGATIIEGGEVKIIEGPTGDIEGIEVTIIEKLDMTNMEGIEVTVLEGRGR